MQHPEGGEQIAPARGVGGAQHLDAEDEEH
jgi:hypothetical protein